MRRLLLQVVLHFGIVSILAPSIGGTIFNLTLDWGDAGPFHRVLGALVGGFVLNVFMWFFNLLLGISTFCLCAWLCSNRIMPIHLWLIGGAAIGCLYGAMIAGGCVHGEWGLLLTSGAAIGLAAAAVLHRLWNIGLEPVDEEPGAGV
jgi:hypothetical protein